MPEAIRAARRFIRALGRKVADADPEDLAEMVTLYDDLDEAMRIAVDGLRRNTGRSDAEIARVLGVTRQAVSQRFPRRGGTMKRRYVKDAGYRTASSKDHAVTEAWMAAYWYARGAGEHPIAAEQFAGEHSGHVRKVLPDGRPVSVQDAYKAWDQGL